MNSLETRLEAALASKKILPATLDNIRLIYGLPGAAAWEKASIGELVEGEHWTELDDRFYKTLTFGTGGLRGRTIGKVVTRAETGTPTALGRPEYPAVGTNVMNYFNINRAVQGLVNYLKKSFAGQQPSFVLSHDTRHFSREFAELAASIISGMGGKAYLFAEDRSTPELSFAVRHLKAHGGAMITASHNPPHDNGFKVYFSDGAQIVEPHASGIIQEVLAVKEVFNDSKKVAGGSVVAAGAEVDEAYLEAMSGLVLEPEIIKAQADKLKLVFTNIHGTGIRSVPPILKKFGFRFSVVPAQEKGDGRFPTVKSPNPENGEALALAIEQARKEGADLVLATDPDADRMGVAVRTESGKYELLSGNQIGSIMGAYRLERMFAKGWITQDNASHAAFIKTFVTTDLQKSIAAAHGIKCVDTLTGFKYIGGKLGEYEALAGGRGSLDGKAWREKLLEKSTFFVFGGEESYGYLAGDYARDKDANAAVLVFAEVAAFARSQNRTLVDYLNELYLKYGFYWEKLGTLTFEGAEGAAKIKRLVESYKLQPPAVWGGKKVEKFQNFADDEIYDVDGKRIPSELMLLFYLEGGARVAVRASGTEPKIKFYFFMRGSAGSEGELEKVKAESIAALDALWDFTRADVDKRVG